MVTTETRREKNQDTIEEVLPSPVKTVLDELNLGDLSKLVSQLNGEDEMLKRNQEHPFKLGSDLKYVATSKHQDDSNKATTSTEVVISSKQGSGKFFAMPKLRKLPS